MPSTHTKNIKKLVSCCSKNSAEDQADALEQLSAISMTRGSASAILSAGGLGAVAHALRNEVQEDLSAHEAALKLLYCLRHSEEVERIKLQDKIAAADLYPHLCKLIQGDIPAQVVFKASAALSAGMKGHPPGQQRCYQLGLLRRCQQLLLEGGDRVRQTATVKLVGAVCQEYPDAQDAAIELGLLSPITTLLRSPDLEDNKAAAAAVDSLVCAAPRDDALPFARPRLQDAFVAAGAAPPLVELLRRPEVADVAYTAVAALGRGNDVPAEALCDAGLAEACAGVLAAHGDGQTPLLVLCLCAMDAILALGRRERTVCAFAQRALGDAGCVDLLKDILQSSTDDVLLTMAGTTLTDLTLNTDHSEVEDLVPLLEDFSQSGSACRRHACGLLLLDNRASLMAGEADSDTVDSLLGHFRSDERPQNYGDAKRELMLMVKGSSGDHLQHVISELLACTGQHRAHEARCGAMDALASVCQLPAAEPLLRAGGLREAMPGLLKYLRVGSLEGRGHACDVLCAVAEHDLEAAALISANALADIVKLLSRRSHLARVCAVKLLTVMARKGEFAAAIVAHEDCLPLLVAMVGQKGGESGGLPPAQHAALVLRQLMSSGGDAAREAVKGAGGMRALGLMTKDATADPRAREVARVAFLECLGRSE